jgi:predicted DNA binding protein
MLVIKKGYFESPARISAEEPARSTGLSRSTAM